MSKLATILGIVLGVIILALGMIEYQNMTFISAFLNWQGLLLVLGGTFAATLINYPLSQVKTIFQGLYKTIASEPLGYNDVFDEILRLSQVSRATGLLSIERETDALDDKFLRMAMTEMFLHETPEQVRQSLDNRLLNLRSRHQSCQEIYINMASYAPAFGMLGTVMGLIMMMTTQVVDTNSSYIGSDASDMLGSLLNGMGLALVTTFYGVLFANLLFMPVAGKLKVLSDAEVMRNEMIIQGTLSLKAMEPTLLIREKLMAFVNDQARQKLDNPEI